jgi:hypothetical protein
VISVELQVCLVVCKAVIELMMVAAWAALRKLTAAVELRPDLGS